MRNLNKNRLAGLFMVSSLCFVNAFASEDSTPVIQGTDTSVVQTTTLAPSIVDPAQATAQVHVFHRIQLTEAMTLDQRLQPFLDSQDPSIAYNAQKAKMWLSYSENEASEGSLSLAHSESKTEAQKIIEKLESGDVISPTTSIISASKVMRRDLWVTAELLKQHPGFECATTDLAQGEVMLVWAAAEHCELGWRHSREVFAAAERLIDKASYEAFNCRAGLPQTLPHVTYPSFDQLNGTQAGCHGAVMWPIWSPAQPEVVVEKTPETPVIPNLVHFSLDQSDLSIDSQKILSQIAIFLSTHPDYTVTLYGYTDGRASAQYNLALSARRADAVESYLNDHGVAKTRIATIANGKTQIVADTDSRKGHALSRRVKLVYVSGDGKEIVSAPQLGDLQL
jgi:outer membrane protein OmpA-like peptidoglycan-associated protein